MSDGEARDKFEFMVRAFSADVYRYAYSLCRDRHTAEDLTQETFARAWKAFGSLRDEASVKAWLFTTVRRENARLHERYRPAFSDIDPDTLAATGHEDLDAMAVHAAMGALPAKFRDVLALQVLGGYTGSELADMLGVPVATINTRLFRARQKLTQALKRKRVPGHASRGDE